MKYLFTVASCLLFSLIGAQSPDVERLNRDLEVAAEVLSTLLDQGQEHQFPGLWQTDIEVRHVEDVGAVFSIPRNRMSNSQYSFVLKDDGLSREPAVISETISGSNEDAAESGERLDNIIEATKLFLADYGSLLRNLTDSEKVIIKTATPNRHNRFFYGVAGRASRKLSTQQGEGVEISASIADILAHDQGKISADEFDSRIEVRKTAEKEEVREPELDVFSSIIYRVFSEEFSKTYYMDSHPYYDRLGDFGVTYQVKVYSSSSEDGLHRIPTLGKENLTKEERDDLVNGLYDQFVEDFKMNVLDYGHTLRSIEDDEAVMFFINLTDCKNCSMPKEIELSVKKSVLNDFRSGSLDLDNALDKFSLKKIR